MRWLGRVVVVVVLAACVWLLGQDDGPERTGFQSFAKFQGEEEAIRKAESLGVGEVSWEAPAEAVVNTHITWKIRFTVGKAGMKSGGGIWLCTAHDFRWDMWGGVALQTGNPRAENYLSYRTSTGARLDWTVYGGRGQPSLFRPLHPWQNVNEFRLAGPDLVSGDFIEITIGDTSGGSPGVRVQEMDETEFLQKVYVDALGKGEYLPLRESPRIRVVAAAAKEMKVTAASDWVVGVPGWVNVWLDDGLGNPAANYRGTVTVEAESTFDYTFRAEDRGAHRFEDIRFERPGTYRLRVRSKDGGLAGESNPFEVHEEAPKQRIYWGDLHTHTMYSDGRGTPAETYEFGRRVAALDFCAVTDHAFITTPWMWQEIIETTHRYNEPGRYVTLLGYEWSGQSDVGGDHNVYTSDREMPIIRSANGFNYDNLRMYQGANDEMNLSANHVEHLFRLLGERFRNENLLAIPHYGGRRGNPAWHNPRIQRQIEIFSDHRRSEDWTSTFLEKGYRIGVMASTDNHSGNAGYGVRRVDVTRGEEGEVFSRFSPKERGTALVAAYAGELTRGGIFQAIYHRQTYATTGSRIIVRFAVSNIPMGSEGKVRGAPRIEAAVVGTAAIRTVRIVKNGKVVHAVSPGAREGKLEYTDSSGTYDKQYYYLDVVQEDGEKAVSSPVWVNW